MIGSGPSPSNLLNHASADWAAAADWCYAHEPFLSPFAGVGECEGAENTRRRRRYHYELARSDKDPLRYLIYERYRSKADYLGAHRSSPAFLAFRPKMKALQDAGRIVVSGHSYDEAGVGFT